MWMVLQIVFHMASSRRPRGLGRFADSNSIPWSQTTTSHLVLAAATLLKSLLVLVGQLFQLCHFVSDRWNVEMWWFHDNSSHALPNSCGGSNNFYKLFFRLMRRFCFARIRFNPLSGKILYHDSVPVIVPWFTSLDPCDQPSSRHQTFLHEVELRQCVSLQRTLIILVRKQTSQFWSVGKWIWTLCFLDFHTFVGCSRSESWDLCADAINSDHQIFFEFLQPLRKICQRIVRIPFCHLSFHFGFSIFFLDSGPNLLVASSLCSNTEPEDELEAALFPEACYASLLNESCDSDSEDELLPKLAENPGTARGTKLSVLETILFSSLVNRGFWPLTHRSIRGLRKACLTTARVSSSCCTFSNWFKSWTITCASSWVCTSPLTMCTTVKVLTSSWIFCSSCALMLLNQLRIRAPSGLVEVGAGITFASTRI